MVRLRGCADPGAALGNFCIRPHVRPRPVDRRSMTARGLFPLLANEGAQARVRLGVAAAQLADELRELALEPRPRRVGARVVLRGPAAAAQHGRDLAGRAGRRDDVDPRPTDRGREPPALLRGEPARALAAAGVTTSSS